MIDEFQPVAALLDRRTGNVRQLVSWPEAQIPRFGWRPAGDRDGLWLQPNPTGPLLLIGPSGIARATYLNQLELTAAGPGGAWCIPTPPMQDLADRQDVPPRQGRPRDTHVRIVTADGNSQSVTVQGRIDRTVAARDALYLRVQTLPWQRVPLGGSGPSWELTCATHWLRVPFDEPVPAEITLADHAVSAPGRPVNNPGPVGGVNWHDGANAIRHGPALADSVWTWGWDKSSTRHDRWGRTSVVSGYDSETGVLRRRIELGVGAIVAGVVDGQWLWLAISRRSSSVPFNYPVSVLRVDPRTGEKRTVLAPDAVDITGRGWPAVARPLDAVSYERCWLENVKNYCAMWIGQVQPTPGMSDSVVELVRDWPDTVIRVSFRHGRYPGIGLVRSIALYDELGRPAPPGDAGVYLMEDVESGLAGPGSAAVNGILEI